MKSRNVDTKSESITIGINTIGCILILIMGFILYTAIAQADVLWIKFTCILSFLLVAGFGCLFTSLITSLWRLYREPQQQNTKNEKYKESEMDRVK